MPRRGDNIRKRNDGRWEGRYMVARSQNGKPVYKSVYAKTYSEVKQKLLSISEKERDTDREPLLFKKAAYDWLKKREKEIKRSSAEKYNRLLEKHILPEFASVPVDCIFSGIIEDYFSRISEYTSQSTMKTMVCIFKGVIEYAHELDPEVDPVGKIRIPKAAKTPQRNLSRYERVEFEEYLLSEHELCCTGIYLCLYTGMRIGELCALRWSDIDLKNGIIHIRKTVQRLRCRQGSERKTELVLSPPKTEASMRDIPLTGQLCSLLSDFQNEDSVFFLSGTDSPTDPRTLQYRFKRILKKAGIEDVNFHALRHSFATECIEVGVDVKTLSEILGHTSVEITLNRYVHSSDERKRSQMELLFRKSGQRKTEE